MSIQKPYDNICNIVHEFIPNVPILISRESVELLERSKCELYLTCENIVELVTKFHEKYFGVSKSEKESLQNDILFNVKTYNGCKIAINDMDIDLKIYDAQTHISTPIEVDGIVLTIVSVPKLITINGKKFSILPETELTLKYLKELIGVPPGKQKRCIVFKARQNEYSSDPKLVSIDDDHTLYKLENHTKFIIHSPPNRDDVLFNWKDL